MFFIFGWGRRTTNEQGPTVFGTCPNCDKQNWFQLFSFKTWFTLFFIPVIPYESKHLLICPVCSRGVQLRGDQIDKARNLNRLAKTFLSNGMSEQDYIAATNDIKLFG